MYNRQQVLILSNISLLLVVVVARGTNWEFVWLTLSNPRYLWIGSAYFYATVVAVFLGISTVVSLYTAIAAIRQREGESVPETRTGP